MEAKVTYVAPRDVFVQSIAMHLRRADANEARAIHGADCDFEAVLRQSVRLSEQCEVGISHRTGLPILIRGVAPAVWDRGVGAVWMVGTNELEDYARNLLIEGRQWVEQMLVPYRLLFNYVDARNEASIRWLGKLGFEFGEPEPYGLEGRDFLMFKRWRDGVRAGVPPL